MTILLRTTHGSQSNCAYKGPINSVLKPKNVYTNKLYNSQMQTQKGLVTSRILDGDQAV
jgi:hypothetical protein